jgi:type I restriction enzyme, S subunit
MNGEVPEGWSIASIGEVASRVVVGYVGPCRQDYDPEGLPFLMGKNVRASGLLLDNLERVTHQFHEREKKSQLTANDVVVVRIGRSGTAAVIPEGLGPANCGGLVIVKAPKAVLPRYLVYYLNSPTGQQASLNETRGVTRQTLNTKSVEAASIPVAPVKEQLLIVAALDELLAKVDSCRKRLEAIPIMLKRFRQAVLAEACSGRLTEDWRSDLDAEPASALAKKIRQDHEQQGLGHGGQAALPTEGVHDLTQDGLPDSWTVEELRFLCRPGRPITYGILKPGPDTRGGIPYIRVADFPKDYLKLGGIRRTTPQIANMYRRSALREGDLLLSIRGTAGRVCRVPAELDAANITQDTARLSIHPEVHADYIELYLRCPSAQKRLERAMKGVAVRGVNIGDVRVLQVALPPKEEQAEIVRRVSQLFRAADVIEEHLLKAFTRAERLTQSILAKAFRGELVPTEAELARRQGREYEPASMLLERIKKERDATESEKHRSKRKSSRSAKEVEVSV